MTTAVISNNQQIVEILRENNTSLCKTNSNQETPLVFAARTQQKPLFSNFEKEDNARIMKDLDCSFRRFF